MVPVGASVGAFVGFVVIGNTEVVADFFGPSVSNLVGTLVDASVGTIVGFFVIGLTGAVVGIIGDFNGAEVAVVGVSTRDALGAFVRTFKGAFVGTLNDVFVGDLVGTFDGIDVVPSSLFAFIISML